MNYYSGNTAANYITHLPSAIELTGGEWEVALVEAHYPCTFMIVDDDAEIIVTIKKEAAAITLIANMEIDGITKNGVFKAKVGQGDYRTITELINVLNAIEDLQSLISFSVNDITKRVEAEISDQVIMVEFSEKLSLQLGVERGKNLSKTNRMATRPHNVIASLPMHMYVYCDLVEPQTVGDTVAPLLKILNIDNTNFLFGAQKIVHIIDPHYVPVMKTNFESVEIDLRDSIGKRLPFMYGFSCIKLHLRRVST